MGNKHSDQEEEKYFNIIKNVPLISLIYRPIRAKVYQFKGNQEQVNKCWQFKLSNLYWGKCLKNLIVAVNALNKDMEKGIWIGKRTLKKALFGATFKGGIDLMHWAVMIEGVVDQLSDKDSEGYCMYKISGKEDYCYKD